MESPLKEESSLKRVDHTLLKERREKINGRMMRKCSIIEDILFSDINRIAVEGKLAQLNDLFKMLLNINEEYS